MQGFAKKESVLVWCVRIIAINLLLQIALSYKLWLSSIREFPQIPVFAELSFDFLLPLEYPLFVLLILSLLMMIWRPTNRWVMPSFFFLAMLFVLQDINRLQTWFYQMSLLLMILSLRHRNLQWCSQVLAIGIIFTYFWSGLHKLNVYFVEDVFPWFFEPIQLDQFLMDNPFLAFLGAIVETVLGLLLIWRISRNLAVFSLIGFHLVILMMLGPIGHSWNEVVWPWNITMPVLIYLIFYQQEDLWKGLWTNLKSFPIMMIFLLLFGLFPALNLVKAWDDPLSFKMYSGTNAEGSVFFYKNEENCFPNYLKKDIFGNNRKRLLIDKWSFQEMQVSPYNAPRILKRLGKKICECLDDPENTHFEILTVDRWKKKKEHYQNYPCAEFK